MELHAYDKKAPYVFVSYARANEEKVFRDVAKLQSNGVNVWIDQANMIGGKPVSQTDMVIRDENCKAVLFYLCEKSVFSKFCLAELKVARKYDIQIIPVHCFPVSGLEKTIYSLQRKLPNITDEDVQNSDMLIRDILILNGAEVISIAYNSANHIDRISNSLAMCKVFSNKNAKVRPEILSPVDENFTQRKVAPVTNTHSSTGRSSQNQNSNQYGNGSPAQNYYMPNQAMQPARKKNNYIWLWILLISVVVALLLFALSSPNNEDESGSKSKTSSSEEIDSKQSFEKNSQESLARMNEDEQIYSTYVIDLTAEDAVKLFGEPDEETAIDDNSKYFVTYGDYLDLQIYRDTELNLDRVVAMTTRNKESKIFDKVIAIGGIGIGDDVFEKTDNLVKDGYTIYGPYKVNEEANYYKLISPNQSFCIEVLYYTKDSTVGKVSIYHN